jgi:hypothetical protein
MFAIAQPNENARDNRVGQDPDPPGEGQLVGLAEQGDDREDGTSQQNPGERLPKPVRMV